MEGLSPEQIKVEKDPVFGKARAYVLDLFNQKQDARLVFHNYPMSIAIAEQVEAIAAEEDIGETPKEIAFIAALMLYTGYLTDPNDYKIHSQEAARRFANRLNYPQGKLEEVLQCMQVVESHTKPENESTQLLSDAVQIVTRIEDYFTRSPLLRLEWELLRNQTVDNFGWAKLQLQELLGIRLYTHTAKLQYEPLLAQHIQTQKEQVEKLKNNQPLSEEGEDGMMRKFQNIERKIPSRATQTFFRSNYRNHINLSAIADNKANIMISVNSILISVLITFLSYRNIGETNPSVLLPVIIFLVTGLASLIFAVLSARPKVTMLNQSKQDLHEIKKNIVFFGNFVTLDLDQYEAAMDAMFRDGELMYGNMTRDLYFLGKVLDKKYRYLTISYNIFMVGFIATVGTFLFALFA